MITEKLRKSPFYFPAIFGWRTCLNLYPSCNQLLGVYSKILKNQLTNIT